MHLPFYETLEAYIKKANDESGFRLTPWPLVITGLVFLVIAYLFMSSQVAFALSLALFLAPVWLSLLLLTGAWIIWVIYVRSQFIASQQYIVLELRPPRGIVKTPIAMETIFAGLHLAPGESTWWKRWWKGAVRPYFSFEIASLEGQVHFFIWTRAGFKKLIEAQIYAQYPGAQLVEVPDYTKLIPAQTEEWSFFGCDYKHTDKNPVPIKSYVEYGLDKVQEEPEQTDPLANLIEFMGSIGKNEYLWLQVIIRVHKGDIYAGELNAAGKPMTWIDEASAIIEKIRKDTRSAYIDPNTGKEMPGFPNPTKGQSELMAAIERNVSKQAFDVGIRCGYFGKGAAFNGINASGLSALYKQFSAEPPWNGIKWTHWMTDFNDYPWEIGVAKLKREYQEWFVDAYRRRQYFYDPYATSDYMIMSTEELATIYHIPSRAVETPSLQRISSATAEAPSNLPI